MFTNTVVVQNYIADGVTDTFALPFYTLPSNPDWIKVKQADNTTFLETDFTLGVHYELSPNETNPVNVVFTPGNIPVAANGRIVISREVPLTQSASFTNTGPFQKENYEKVVDKLVMQVQQLSEKIGRAPLFAYNQLIDSAQILGVPVAGNLLKWKDTLGNIDTSGASAEDMEAYAEAAQAAAEEAQQYGSGVTPFAFTNNMGATAVTGQTGASATVRARVYEIACVRGLLVGLYQFAVIWNGTTWQKTGTTLDGDDCGLTFTLTGTTTYTLNVASTNAVNGGNIYAFTRNVLV